MEKQTQTGTRLMVVTLAIGVMGLLCGWAAYAAGTTTVGPLNITIPQPTAIDSPIIDKEVTDVNNVAVNGSALNQPPAPQSLPGGLQLPGGVQSPTQVPPGISDAAIQFLQQLGENVQSMINNTANTDFYGTGIEAAKAMVTRHFSSYCGGVETGNCPSDPLLQFGDVKVSSILSGTAYDGPSGPRTQAAQDYLTNLFVPPTAPLVANFTSDLKNGTLDVDNVVSDSTLLKKYTQALSDETLLSVPKQSFSEMMARRTVAGSNAGGVSEMQLMEAEALKRFMSPAWMQTTKNPNTTAIQIQQEMAIMQAYQNWMAYQQFRQLERIEALLSALIVQNARTAQAMAASVPTGATPTDVKNAAAGQPGSTSSTNTTQ